MENRGRLLRRKANPNRNRPSEPESLTDVSNYAKAEEQAEIARLHYCHIQRHCAHQHIHHQRLPSALSGSFENLHQVG